jgi:hypothetical protein
MPCRLCQSEAILCSCLNTRGVLTTPQVKQTVTAFEIYQKIAPSLVSDMFLWIRENDRPLYKSAIASLAANRRLRPVFVEKKSIPDQIAWLHKTLKLRTSDTVGEHLFQVYFMKGHQDILIGFCDGMGIEHDGEGSVEGSLPETLDDEKLKTTIDTLLGSHDPKLVTLYLQVFNLQTPDGWKNLEALLESDARLILA